MKTITLAISIVLLAFSSTVCAQDTAIPMTAAPTAASGATVHVPVTRVVLFSSGVGYFEHAGTVDGNATMQLMFKTEQINDVLKSMLLADLGGGTITSVNYASREPLARVLKSFAIDLSGNPDMAALLAQIRGAEVVVAAPDRMTGKILGVEQQTRQLPGPPPTIITETYLNLVTSDGIKSLPMDSIQNITLADERLAGELNKALEMLLASRDTQRKALDINFAGRGSRSVRVGYVTETPVWKTSYRLDLGEKKPLIQGWAIVENTTDSDWTNVRLSLISGRPISFIQDLYTPLYMPRPTVVPEMYASLRPQIYEEGMEAEKGEKPAEQAAAEMLDRRMMAVAPSAAPMGMARERKAGAAGLAFAENAPISLTGGGVGNLATAAKAGELFEYDITEGISLPRQRSAMLPIINSPISAEKVSVYNQSILPKNPLNGAYLTNDTGLKMLGGPVTVLDGGVYAGDARIDNLVPGDKRLISYAIDLNVTVDPSMKTDSRITAAKIVRGVLQVKRLQTYKQTYAVKNKADARRTMIIEHPFIADRKLIEPAKFEEKTPALYRFRLAVEPNATIDFPVKEEHVQDEIVAILDCPIDAINWFATSGEVSKSVRDALAKAIEIKNKLSEMQAKVAATEKQLSDIEAGQDRLRKNIGTAGRDSSLGKRYLEKLNQEENTIEQLEKTLAEQRAAVVQLEKQLADYINNLNIE